MTGRRDREQHLIYGDLRGAGKNNGAFNHILKLAHVAGPVVSQEPRHRLWIEGEMRPLEFYPDLRQEMLRQQMNVLAPVSQWGDRDGKNMETVEQVRAKGPLLNGGLEVGVGGSNQSNID